jgi:cysteine desulfurase/selenocysteine lyase
VNPARPATRPAPDAKATRPFGAAAIRREFPILERKVHGKRLVYLDNAATTQKPRAVIDAVSRFYEETNANVHRGVHLLSQEATKAFEATREAAREFLGAAETREIVFTRGTTESVNLVAQSYGRANVRAGDEVLITAIEHHSDIVPWQMLCEATGARLVVAPVDDRGEVHLDEVVRRLSPRTKIVAVTHASNALGTIVPVREVARAAHERGIPVFVDGAQAAPHLPVDVRALDVDFYAFSGHKVYGPTGTGVLYGKAALLDAMPPWMGGGDMIESVTFEKTTYAHLPSKFEAGTPDVAGVVGLGAALRWVLALDREAVLAHEGALLARATTAVGSIPGVRLIGTAREKVGVLSFVMDGVHPHDVGTILDREGIAVRTGHHCAQPVMARYGIPATTRASFALYNLPEEVDALVAALGKVREVFA